MSTIIANINSIIVGKNVQQGSTLSFTPYDETDLNGYGLTAAQINIQLAHWVTLGITGQIIDIRGNTTSGLISNVDYLELILTNNILFDA